MEANQGGFKLYYESIITIVCLLLYFRTLRFKFVSDDFAVWKNPPKYKNRWQKGFLRFIGSLKLRSMSYIPQFRNGKLTMYKIESEEKEHLYALLLHILICIMIYYSFGKNQISFVAALLYATNAMNNQGTIWPGGRGYALPILGLLIAMSSKYLAPIGLLGCSWFTIGYLAPLAFIGSKWVYLLCWMPLVWLLVLPKFKKAVVQKATMESFAEDQRMHIGKLVLLVKTFGFYLTHCLFPYRITFYHYFLQSMAGNDIMRKRAYSLDKFFWIGLVAGLSWFYYAMFVSWNTFTWAIFAFMITIVPFCNLRRANQEIAERFAALPNVFLMYALAQVIWQSPIAIAIFLTFYATRTYYTLAMYKDEYWITEIAVSEDPYAWWAWHCRAMKRWETKSYQEALILWTMAKLISPKEFKVLMNIATCLRLMKNHDEADKYLKLAEENIVEGQEQASKQFILQHKQGNLPILL